MQRKTTLLAKLGNRLAVLALVVALLAALIPSAAGAEDQRPEKMHGHLKRMATQRPDDLVPVIVQKGEVGGSVERDIESVGGRIVQDLGEINAFAAEVPAKQVLSASGKAGVKWISYDAPVISTGVTSVDTDNLSTAYPFAVMAPSVWNGTGYSGDGVAVAVVDSGIENDDRDIAPRLVASTSMLPGARGKDEYGHGTHIAGIIAGNGTRSDGKYIGVAPRAKLVSVKVSNRNGVARTSDVIRGILWAVINKDRYGIKVINLSLSSTVAQSYLTDPLDAAVELAWFNGIVVVASAGNLGVYGDAVQFAPGNDPFVISVGAVDDVGTNTRDDDVLMSWSSRGKTQDGFDKPDVVAPGRRIVSLLSEKKAVLAREHPELVIDAGARGKPSYYFKMGGTSTSAPAVVGVVALMLQAHPEWTPDQVKWQLMNSADVLPDGSRYVRADRAVSSRSAPLRANAGVVPSLQLFSIALNLRFNNVAWNNVAWNNVAWNNVAWNNVAWNNVAWNNVAWNNVAWNNVAWNNVAWNNVAWNNVAWNNVAWNNVAWNNVAWNGSIFER